MQAIEDTLRERLMTAIGTAFGAENATDPLVKIADPKFADYQSNVAMALAKSLGRKPREVADAVVKHAHVEDLCEPITIAGPGFINLRIKKEFLAKALDEELNPTSFPATPAQPFRAGVQPVENPQTVVIDYSGPNVAKQMHVGHLRSTIIGDTLARVLSFLGHNVIRQNHIGDFGTQFGMLIHHLREKNLADKPVTIEDLDRLYKEATDRFRTDKSFAVQARKTVVELQQGQPAAVELWNRMRVATHRHYTEVYQSLGVLLTDDDERGESFYKDRLEPLVQRLEQTLPVGGEEGYAGIGEELGTDPNLPVDTHDLSPAAAEAMRGAIADNNDVERITESKEPLVVGKPFCTTSGGAVCVFLPGYVDRDKKPLPLMVKKSDGGFPYSATDMAALYFRVQEHKTTPAEQKPLKQDWHADRVIYLTDNRQSQHFAMVFDAFRAAQWDLSPRNHHAVTLEHAPFGTMLGEDGKPFKTRSGDTVKLKDLLAEAIDRAANEIEKKNPQLKDRERVARAVGVAAVKYADLRQDRTTDYVFSMDRMVSFEGNTGPYLQYAYARIQSIFAKANVTPESVADSPGAIALDHPLERALALKLLQFAGTLESVARDLKPHHLCSYLYDLASAFSGFYAECPVLQAEPATRTSRLKLCHLVGETLRLGLGQLMGIEVVKEM